MQIMHCLLENAIVEILLTTWNLFFCCCLRTRHVAGECARVRTVSLIICVRLFCDLFNNFKLQNLIEYVSIANVPISTENTQKMELSRWWMSRINHSCRLYLLISCSWLYILLNIIQAHSSEHCLKCEWRLSGIRQF